MPDESFKHWAIEEKDNGIVWLNMDVDGSSTNVLSVTVLAEFYQILTKLAKNPPIGIAITSKKEKGFIAGADVKEFTKISNHQEAL